MKTKHIVTPCLMCDFEIKHTLEDIEKHRASERLRLHIDNQHGWSYQQFLDSEFPHDKETN